MQITTGENARLRWLQKAVAGNDKRPVLQCVHVNGSVVAAADGFRFHVVRTPWGFDGRNAVKLPKRILKRDTEIEIETADHTSPDFSALVPRTEPVLEVCVNIQYLKEALQGMDGIATLRFHGPRTGFELLSRAPADDTDVYALIMPIVDTRYISKWRPYQ